jgi:amidase
VLIFVRKLPIFDIDLWFSSANPTQLTTMFVRRIASFGAALFVLIQAAPLSFGPRESSPSLLDISIQELGDLLDEGAITSHELVDLYFQRIDQVNNELHAVLELSDEALTVARERDTERASGRKRGPLHGIPILIKDNYATTDSMLTGAGSVCLAKSRPSKEATVVAKLRRAGAIILGKTNLSEFSSGRGNFSEGWSARGNQTFGAYVEHQTACGSSSGSGVAASLGLAAATLGTETAGSITCPAFVNNVVGIKPTVGLTSRFGVVPLTARQDTTGPIVQSVADAALILEVIAGKDENDNYTLAQPWDTPPNYRSALNVSALHGRRLGAVFMEENAPNETFANAHQINRVFDAALGDLRAGGAEVVEIKLGFNKISLHNSYKEIIDKMRLYGTPDFAEGMTRYMKDLVPDPKTPHTLADLLECMEADPDEFASDVDISGIRRIAQTNQTSDSMESWEAYTTAKKMARDILFGPIKEMGLDALVMILETAIIFTATPGLPIITVPMGMLGDDASTVWNNAGTAISGAPGFPLGLSFVADQWTEHELIGYAYAYEQVSKRRKTMEPYIKIDIDLDTILKPVMKTDL